jgi:hypothetical protein
MTFAASMLLTLGVQATEEITIRKMTNDRRSKGKAVLTDMISENPLIGQLVEKLNLEVVDL